MTVFLPLAPPSPGTPAQTKELATRQVARELEVSFLAEMLKSAGVGEQTSNFAGGIGENQFALFQRQALAEEMVASGGIGLSEHIFKSLMERSDES